MVRVFLHYVLPLLTPLALYIGWVLIARRRAGARGADLSQDWRKGPWHWLALAGIVLAGAVIFVVGQIDRSGTGSTYVPPKTIDGKIEPGHMVPKSP